MNKRTLLNIVLTLSVSGFSTSPALAQVQPPAPSVQNQALTIPQSAAITITFPTTVTLDADQKKSLTTTAYLASPLLDSSGNVVAMANSPINIQLQPTKGGAQIKADALVIGGQVIPIFASGPLIPDHKVTTASAVESQANQGLFSSVAGSVVSGLLSAFGGATQTSNAQVTNLANLGNVVGTGLSTISRLSSPKTTRQVEISQGSVYILTLQAPVFLQPNVVPTTLPTPTAAIPSVATSTVPPAQSQGSATAFITQREAVPASATVIYVNSATGADSAGKSGKTDAAPYKTITYALSQAQPGTVIQLATGSYTDKTGEVFPLVLKQGVTLRGDESNKGQSTVITGGGFYISPTFARQDVTVRAENNSTITGVSISNPNTRGTAVWIESTNPTVKNSTFVNSNREGIFVTGIAAPKIEANIFTRNGGNGISVTRSAQGEICNNLFQDTGFGLAIGDTSFPVVVGNKIIQNTYGMVISDDARPLLRHNVIENNLHSGVVVSVNARPNLGTVESAGKNIIRSNGDYDIDNATTNTLVAVGNDINSEQISGQVAFEATSQVGVGSSQSK